MNSWKIILATVVIFGTGVVTGGLLVNHVDRTRRDNHRALAPAETRPPSGERDAPGRTVEIPRPRQPELLSTNFVKRLGDALKLTPEQRSSIERIIAEGQEQNHTIWTNNAEQMRKVMQDVRHRLREVLSADQQKEFEELLRHAPRHPPPATNAPPAPGAPTNTPAI